jgi:S-adenosylhomocysteine hydrolase
MKHPHYSLIHLRGRTLNLDREFLKSRYPTAQKTVDALDNALNLLVAALDRGVWAGGVVGRGGRRNTDMNRSNDISVVFGPEAWRGEGCNTVDLV